MRSRAIAALAASLLVLASIAVPASASHRCVYSGGGWICSGGLPDHGPDVTVERVAGPDRYATAVALSQRSHPDGADVVYLASGTTLVDALTAGAVADGPILLVPTTHVPEVVAAELARLRPGHLVVLGGTTAVPDDVLTAAAHAARG